MVQEVKISCKEASRLISQEMDSSLPVWERVRLRVHLAICDACSNFSRHLRFLRRAIKRLP
jgi:hypothetical protein